MLRCLLCGRSACSCKEDTRKRAYLPDIIEQDTKLFGRGEQFRAACPFHQGSDQNFAVFLGKDGAWYYKCHVSGCEASGDVYSYLTKQRGLTFGEALLTAAGQTISVATPIVAKPKIEIAPLDWDIVQTYHHELGTQKHPTLARKWWYEQGVTDPIIERFFLGYCLRCPTAFDRKNPRWTTPSYTIPIMQDGHVLNIRHRLEKLPSSGQRYAPQSKNRGMHLFGMDDLTHETDGSPREVFEEVLIVEGEKKKLVAASFGMDFQMPIVTLTGGAGAWYGSHADEYVPLLDNFTRVYVLFDPDANDDAEKTARLFGRRGHVLHLPDKLDDYLLADADRAVSVFVDQCMTAKPIVERSIWRPRIEAIRNGR